MPDREKVIKGLECCSAMSGDECRRCPYSSDCRDEILPVGMVHLANDALELLKEQEPRVLTLEEVQNDCPDYVYLEWHGCCICCIKDEDESDKLAGYFVYGLDGDYFRFLWNTYGVIWRCWTAMPTGKQIKAVKWDE